MAMDNQQIQDPSSQGTSGLRGLDGINRLRERGINIDTSILSLARDYRGTMEEINQAATPRQNIGFVGVGDSMFDEGITSASQLDNLENTRTEMQPWYAQIGAGLAKGVVLAGTTFLDGTIGLLYGIGNALNEGEFSGVWDNDFSRAMKSVNEWAEEAMPNYYTDEQKNSAWYDPVNLFSANFLGDKLIKNLGFTVGAMYSGGVASAGLKALKLPQLVGRITQVANAPKIVASGVGATISAFNEGRIEALNNSEDWYNLHKAQLDESYSARIKALQDELDATKGTFVPMGGDQQGFYDPAYKKFEQQYSDLQKSYQQDLAKLNEDRAKMGNADLLMNLPVLLASNITQFGKMYANGFNDARKALNITGRAGEYASGSTKRGLAWAATKGALSEGTEEMLQSAASRAAGDYYSTDVNNYYKAKSDPDAEQETLSWIKSVGTGLLETVGDVNSWEEFLIGSLTGALGIPSFRSARTKDGAFQSPVYLQEGVLGHIRDYNERVAREERIVDYMNQRVQSPEFLNYYQGLIRHNKYQNDMNRAAADGDAFEFKNAEHAQFVSDVSMFDSAGKLEDLTELISSAYDTSNENLEAIVRNTTATTEDGSKVGPFVDRSGNPLYATEEGKKEMIDQLTKTKDEMVKTISSYVKIKNDLDSRTGQRFSDDQLEELTWMQSQLENWSDRAVSMSGEVKETIGKILGNLNSVLNFNLQVRDYEGKTHAELTDTYNIADKNVQAIQRAISNLEKARALDDNRFAITMAQNPDFVKGLIQEVEALEEDILDTQEKEEAITKLNDIVKLGNASTTYRNKFKEYLDNPGKQAEDHAKANEKAARRETDKKSATLRDRLVSSANLTEFRDALNSEQEPSIVESTLKALEDEGNEIAKNYRETTVYDKEVKRNLNNFTTDPQTLQDALTLFTHHSSNSNTLDEIANPNSVFINDETMFDEASNGDVEVSTARFLSAQYALQTAMSKANNDNKFKDRFSDEYKRPIEKREGPVRGNSKEETGDSRTSTVPPVNNRVAPTQPEKAVGDITQDEVSKDNKSTNDAAPTTRELDKVQGQRPYYRPAIPELHIDASREGDFRPFYEVVAEREKGVDFSEIYNYLRDSGAFDYLNASNLREGSELAFMIDPNFNDHTIFIVDKSNRQIVGSLDEGDRSVSRYIGLRELIDNIHKEFEGREDKESKDIFIATPTTRVSKVMVGKIPYSTETRSLAEIPGVLDGDKAPIFGIVKNGTLTTNDKVDDNLIVKPVDMSNKEGRLYLLIPNGAGKYSPAAVRVKHFNSEEFNLDDTSIVSTPMGKSISSAIDRLVSASSQDGVSEAMKDLAQEIHMQDVIITWFNSPSGNGIVVSRKVRNADGSYKMITINGKEQIQESKTSIYYNEKGLATVGDFEVDEAVAIASGYDPSIIPLVPKNPEVIKRSIVNTLQSMNLPLQVSVGRINSSGYNKRIINSGITTSNILEARTLGTWFTTDYFDKDGNLHQATSPASVTPEPRRRVETPVGGKESAIEGVPVTSVYSGKSYYVDLKTNTIRDNQGQVVNVTPKNRILFDIAWANSNYGDATVGYNMMDNKVILPSGDVLNRTTQKYMFGDEAKNFKAALERTESDRKARIADSKRVIGEIEESQKRVDKSRTDGEFYYILEDDGQYHEYTRVHSRLGSNSVESPKLVEEINKVKVELQRLVDSPADYDSYLTTLSNRYNVDLSSYKGMTDVRSRETIANIVKDSKLGSNSQRALEAGSAVDSVIRQFFTLSDTSSIVRPDNISEEAFTSLINYLVEVKSNLEQRGETFLTDNIVLFHQYADGSRVAGEVDILAVDKDGNFKIYDVKTSRYSFYRHRNSRGQEVDYFSNRAYWQRMSQRDYYTQQLSAYKNLFESQYGAPVTQLAIMPFVLGYSDNTVSSIIAEKGIPINYSASTPVPLAQRVEPVQTSDAPIFNSTLELQNPVNSIDENSKVVLPNKSASVGYYEMDGKLHKGYLTEIGSVAGVKLHVMKIPNITTGFGKAEAHVASASYGVVFPNGQTVIVLKNSSTDTDVSAVDKVFKALEKNPNRVVEESSKETILSKSISVKQEEQSSASTTVQREQAIMEQDSEFEDVLVLREVTSLENLWDRDSELAWLDRVLPQLSREDRVKIHEGLIKASGNRLAWGAFTNGLMVLSDQAAEGTVYHEAFHVVSNAILTEKQRAGIYAEARKTFGNLSDLEIEETLAEDFRVWVQNGAQDTRTIGRKILDFFKELLSFLNIQPSLVSFYVNINKGKYSDYIINDRVAVTLLRRKYTPDPTMKGLDAEFDRVKESIRALNSTRVFQTEREAYDTFIGKGLSPEFYRGVTRYNPNNAKGFKIKTFTSEEYEQFRDSIKEEMEFYKTESAPVDEGFYKFDSLDPDIQMDLLNKGWTKEEFDSKSPIERKKAVECISF